MYATCAVSLVDAHSSSASRKATRGAEVAEMPALTHRTTAIDLPQIPDSRVDGGHPREVLCRAIVDDNALPIIKSLLHRQDSGARPKYGPGI